MAKSILEVDVNDAKFQAFKKTFDKYKQAVGALPGEWNKAGAAASAAAGTAEKSFVDQAHALAAMTAALSQVVNKQNTIEAGAKRGGRAFKDMEISAGRIAGFVTNTTFQLAKWAALGGIVGLATGFFGAGVAASAGAEKNAAGLRSGATPGQLRAAELSYGLGSGIDTTSLIQNINRAKNDPASRPFLNLLGISGQNLNRSAGDLLPTAIQGIIQRFNAVKGTPQGFAASGLDKFLSYDDALALSRRQPGQLAGDAKAYGSISRTLYQSPGQLDALTNLSRVLGTGESQIGNAVQGSVAQLAPQIAQLSSAIADAIKTVLTSSGFKDVLKDVADGIRSGAAYLTSGEFKQDAADFSHVMHLIAHPWDSKGEIFDKMMFGDTSDKKFGEAIGAAFYKADETLGLVPDNFSKPSDNMSAQKFREIHGHDTLVNPDGSPAGMPRGAGVQWFDPHPIMHQPTTKIDLHLSHTPGTDATTQAPATAARR